MPTWGRRFWRRSKSIARTYKAGAFLRMRNPTTLRRASRGGRLSPSRGESSGGACRIIENCGAQRFCALLFWEAVNGNDSHHRVDEGESERSTSGTSRDRVCADDGGAARGTHGAGGTGMERVLAGVRLYILESETVWAQRGPGQVPAAH